jgi:hypothetical protein
MQKFSFIVIFICIAIYSWGQTSLSDENSFKIDLDEYVQSKIYGSTIDHTQEIIEKDSTIKTVKAVNSLGFQSVFADLRKSSISNTQAIADKETTKVKVYNANENFNTQSSDYLLIIDNRLLVDMSLVQFENILNEEIIKDMIVLKGTRMQIDSVWYKQVKIETWNNYIPKIISLTDLKKKYTTLKDQPTIFMIDENPVITDDYDNFVVDENNLLKISVDTLNNDKENLHVGVIKLFTKSAKNMSKETKMWIR